MCKWKMLILQHKADISKAFLSKFRILRIVLSGEETSYTQGIKVSELKLVILWPEN